MVFISGASSLGLSLGVVCLHFVYKIIFNNGMLPSKTWVLHWICLGPRQKYFKDLCVYSAL